MVLIVRKNRGNMYSHVVEPGAVKACSENGTEEPQISTSLSGLQTH